LALFRAEVARQNQNDSTQLSAPLVYVSVYASLFIFALIPAM
jgi:hypothetical protein